MCVQVTPMLEKELRGIDGTTRNIVVSSPQHLLCSCERRDRVVHAQLENVHTSMPHATNPSRGQGWH